MPLTTQGWDPVTFVEIRAGVVQLWKAAYGSNADTDPNTADGLEISILSAELMLAFDTNTGLWADSFFRSAKGVALGRILDLFVLERAPATESTGTVVFHGTAATAIPAGTVVVTNDTAANRFATDAVDAIGAAASSVVWMVRILLAENGVLQTVQVNAEVPSEYTTQPADDVVDVATGMRDDLNNDGFATATLAGVDSSGNALLVVEIIGGAGNITVTDDSVNTTIDDTEAARVAVTALTAGPLAAAAGTLQVISNPIVGIVGATNDADATIGEARQSDDELRGEHLDNIFRNTSRTDQGMRAAVAKVPDMVENLVVSNRDEDPEDAFGRPIGSVENIVLVEPAGSRDQEIADAIALQIPAGILPFGLREFGTGTTPDGEVIGVSATDVVEKFLHLGITVTAGAGYPTATATEAAIAAAVANYLDAGILELAAGTIIDPTARLVIGKSALRESMNTPINAVTNNAAAGIVILTDTTPLPGDAPTLVGTDQLATKREIIRADASRIAVTIVIV